MLEISFNAIVTNWLPGLVGYLKPYKFSASVTILILFEDNIAFPVWVNGLIIKTKGDKVYVAS